MDVNYNACVSNPYRTVEVPIIENELIHFISQNLLVLPDARSEESIKVKYEFTNFPASFSIITNHILNVHEYEVIDTIKNIARSVIAAGKMDINTEYIKSKPVHFVIQGNWTQFKKEEILNYLKKTILIQRDFTNDHDFPHFVVILLKNTVTEGIVGGVTGMLYNKVLSMTITDVDIKNKSMILGGLSHELFHAWMGNKIQITSPQGDTQWFLEGLNDFYGWQLAIKSGIITVKDYLNYYNELLEEYMISPYKLSTNEEMSRAFSLGNISANTAMARGHIVFMELLNKLIHQNKSRAPIDAAMKEIFHTYSGTNITVTDKALSDIFRKHLGDKLWDEVSKVIHDGAPVTLSSRLYLNNAILQSKKMEVPDFGFDITSLSGERKIKSLNVKSNAAIAGLHENDKVLGSEIDILHPTNMAYILIEESNVQKEIKFYPEKVQKNIPQYG